MSLLPQLRRRHAVLATLALCLSVGVQAQAVVPAPSPPWFQQGAPGPLAEQALDLLAHAQEHGLDPRDYGTARLRQLLNGAGNEPARQAQAESALTSATTTYLRDLRLGRIDPRSLHHDFSVQAQPYDAAAVLQAVRTPQELIAAAQAADAVVVGRPAIDRVQTSSDKTRKWLMQFSDGQKAEAAVARQRVHPVAEVDRHLMQDGGCGCGWHSRKFKGAGE